MQHLPSAGREAPRGIIDTLSAGYAAINRQPWVLLVPILVDLLLWLGPHVSYSPLVEPTVTHATEWARQVASAPSVGRRGAPPAGDPQLTDQLEAARLWTMDRTTSTNALSLLARGPLVVPSLDAPQATAGDASGGLDNSGGMQFVTGWAEGVLLLVVLFGASLLLGGVFYGGVAAASLGTGGGPIGAGRRAPRVAVRVIGLLAALFGVGLLLGLPVLVLVGFTALVAPELALLGGAFVVLGVFLVEIYLFFAVDAICVSNVGPLVAVQRSVGVVRRHLWPTVSLMVLTWLVLAGMGRVWDLAATALRPPFGVLLGILGNAYIGSGLIAAGMIFYNERAGLRPAPSAGAAAPA